jgi:hypothetical protein
MDADIAGGKSSKRADTPRISHRHGESMREDRMRLKNIPFSVTDWDAVPEEVHPGEKGNATWRTRYFGDIRLRLVEYSPGYLADHWCAKGHIIFCIRGEMMTDLMDGRSFRLTAGQSYQVADNDGRHRSHTVLGARLFIVD